MKSSLQRQAGQAGWSFANGQVKAFLTRTGGHLAPVAFRLGRKVVTPFSIAPWNDEALPGVPTMLRVLRGDFFCAPFGGNAAPYRGERHPPHGEPANRDWTFQSLKRDRDAVTLHASIHTHVRRGRIDKRLMLRAGHTAVYCEHVLSGYRGPMPIGTHPMLHFPEAAGPANITTSTFRIGHVVPSGWEEPAAKGYSFLRTGATFSSLRRVPDREGGTVDLSVFPARPGYEELVQLVSDETRPFAWNAVTFPGAGQVFFTIKNPRVLRETVLWFSNGGRHYPPWNGRHCNVLGVEDVTAYFHLGLADSVKANRLTRAGFPTAVQLSPRRPLRVAHILAMAAIPRGFDAVKSITRQGDGVKLTARSGRSVSVPLDIGFVTGR